MALKSHAGTVFSRHALAVSRFIDKIDLLNKMKSEQNRLIDSKKLAQARIIGERIYELECQDEADVIASYTGRNSLGRTWTF